jgi:hypothetical protein
MGRIIDGFHFCWLFVCFQFWLMMLGASITEISPWLMRRIWFWSLHPPMIVCTICEKLTQISKWFSSKAKRSSSLGQRLSCIKHYYWCNSLFLDPILISMKPKSGFKRCLSSYLRDDPISESSHQPLWSDASAIPFSRWKPEEVSILPSNAHPLPSSRRSRWRWHIRPVSNQTDRVCNAVIIVTAKVIYVSDSKVNTPEIIRYCNSHSGNQWCFSFYYIMRTRGINQNYGLIVE